MEVRGRASFDRLSTELFGLLFNAALGRTGIDTFDQASREVSSVERVSIGHRLRLPGSPFQTHDLAGSFESARLSLVFFMNSNAV